MKATTMTLLTAMVLPATLAAQGNPLTLAPRPTTGPITKADLMTRVYQFADDSMMGRQTGSVYHDKGTDYIARELARLGLRPAGENGTFFQSVKMRGITDGVKLTVDGREFVAGRDFLARDPGQAPTALQNAQVVYGGVFPDTAKMIPAGQVAGKVVLFTVPTGWQANRQFLLLRYPAAAGVVVATLDQMPPPVREQLAQPGPTPNPPLPAAPFFYTTGAMTEAMFGVPVSSLPVGATGKTVTGTITFALAPLSGARNVIAILPGSDPALRGQHVAIGAHSDHVGFNPAGSIDHDSLYAFYHIVRPQGADDGNKPAAASDWPKIRALLDSLRRVHTQRQDSIFNGADDNASGSMGMLEVAEAFATAREKPKRSILFVWHAMEEDGLVGASYFTDNPTVPRDSVVAQINIDMIGRGGAADTPGGGPGYVQLIGSRRLSTELGDIVDAEGKRFNPPFRFDYTFDATGHPGQYYCRSDHYMYARYGIPVVFMSTGGHPEYHQITDEPQYLDYDQLLRVSQLVYNVASTVANRTQRLVVDKPKPDPRGQCVQ